MVQDSKTSTLLFFFWLRLVGQAEALARGFCLFSTVCKGFLSATSSSFTRIWIVIQFVCCDAVVLLPMGPCTGRLRSSQNPMARLRHTTGLRSTNPMHGVFRAVKPRIGNRCTASGDLCIRISGINRVLFSYCFRQFLRFRSDTHCFDCWRLVRDFTVTASLTVYNGNFNAIRHEGSKVARNCMDASAIFIINTRNLNPNFSGCRNRIFDFDIPALDLTSFEWTYVLPYARINFPFILPSICLKDMGKTKLIREATCEGHISCCLRVLTIRKRGMYSQYSRRNLGSIICLAFPHVRASVMDHGQEGRVCVITLWP